MIKVKCAKAFDSTTIVYLDFRFVLTFRLSNILFEFTCR